MAVAVVLDAGVEVTIGGCSVTWQMVLAAGLWSLLGLAGWLKIAAIRDE